VVGAILGYTAVFAPGELAHPAGVDLLKGVTLPRPALMVIECFLIIGRDLYQEASTQWPGDQCEDIRDHWPLLPTGRDSVKAPWIGIIISIAAVIIQINAPK